MVEELAQANGELRKENQELRDEVARLKGEQGKPDIKGRDGQVFDLFRF
jgi:cell division protein FtsB